MNDDKHIDFATLKYYDQRNKQYIDTKIDGLKTEFNDVERRVDTLEATSKGHDEQLKAHREELDDLEARVVNLERDDVSIRQDIADLRVAVENSGGGTGGVTKDYVDNAIKDAIESIEDAIELLPIPDVSDFVTKDDLAAASEDFVTDTELTELTNTVASNQVAIEDLQENKANNSDLTGLATEKFVTDKISEIVIPEVPTKVSELENDAGYITAEDIPETDLSNYYNKTETENWVNEQGFAKTSDIPDTSVFVTDETLEETVQNISNTYVTNETLVNNYTKTEDLEANYVSNTTLEEKNYITTAEATTQIEQIVEQKVTEAVTPDSINYDTWE